MKYLFLISIAFAFFFVGYGLQGIRYEKKMQRFLEACRKKTTVLEVLNELKKEFYQ